MPADTLEASPADTAPVVRNLPMVMRAADIVPGSWNPEQRTVQVVWSAGALVRRYDWWNDTEYDEELVMTPEAVDMSRFEAGAIQVLDTHMTRSLRAILGRAVRGWIADGKGMADLVLSQRDDVRGLCDDIGSGIIRNISVGYSVQRFEMVLAKDRTDGGTVPLYRARLWTPSEISFVPVNADMDAGSRSAPHSDATGATHSQRGASPCTFVFRAAPSAPGAGPVPAALHPQEQPAMSDPTRAASPAPATPAAAPVAAPTADEVRAAEATRAADITALCVEHGRPQMAVELIRTNVTVEAAGLAILRARAADESAGNQRNASSVTTVQDSFDTRIRGLEGALMHRVNPREKLDDNARQFRSMSLLEIGRAYLETHGVRTAGMDKFQLSAAMLNFRSEPMARYVQTRSAGLHVTSDFGSLMANIADKRMRAAYNENPGSYQRWARRAPNLTDFKLRSTVQLANMPSLLQVNEAGEFRYGSLTDSAEAYQAITYGRIVSLSRQAIINDDLNAFDRLATGYGMAAMRLQNAVVYAQLTSNPTMADALALFVAGHGNNATGGGSALSETSLTAMRTAMRLQTGLQGEVLNITPTAIIVPAALEHTALKLTSGNYLANQQSSVNEFAAGGRASLEPIVEPILDATSSTAWYGVSNNGQVDTVEFAFVDGAEGPVLETEAGFDTDGVSFKARLDFAAKAVDWRGLYRGVGV